MKSLSAIERDAILDGVEQAYSNGHVKAFSLAASIEASGVEMGALISEFGSRQILVDAVLLRTLLPISIERSTSLQLVLSDPHIQLQPAHVIGCLVLPIIHAGIAHGGPRRMAILERSSADSDTAVRATFSRNFETESALFAAAFVRSLPPETPERVSRNTDIFTNDFPGTVANRSLVRLCNRFVDEDILDYREILLHFGMMAHGLLLGHAHETLVYDCVTDLLRVLKKTNMIQSMESRVKATRH